tara:strand:+ start:818 stop:1210 length:393 start_codon:yes stop_codon:yes gene_type:complete
MMQGLLQRLNPNTLYVQVRANEFIVKHIESGRTCHRKARVPFTSKRLLIGHFSAAQALLRECFRELLESTSRIIRPNAVIHPLEMVEDGLTDVEQRILVEVVVRAGAQHPAIWVGNPLSDKAVREKVREK